MAIGWDIEMQTPIFESLRNLQGFDIDAAHKFLIPRAVAYSTGLLDYFFRGKLEAQDAGFTDTGVSLRVKNAIDPKATPTWKDEALHAPGELAPTYEYKQDNQVCPKDAQHARSRA